MILALKKAKELLLDALFPKICLACGKIFKENDDLSICKICIAEIPILNSLTCPTCSARLPENKKTCHKNISFTLAAATSYQNEIIKDLIWRLKYQRIAAAAKPLAEIIVKHIRLANINLSKYCVVPIPLGKKRERARGFNQSAIIAKHIGTMLNLPLITSALIRVKDTAPQAEIKNFRDRELNVSGSFRLIPERLNQNRKILLLDDVFTSGATTKEAVKTLRNCGIKKVLV